MEGLKYEDVRGEAFESKVDRRGQSKEELGGKGEMKDA